MPELLFMARVFLIGGASLLIVGLILWFALPIASSIPPFMITSLLAMGYGAACYWQHLLNARNP
jgi:uncharacterized membrane protein